MNDDVFIESLCASIKNRAKTDEEYSKKAIGVLTDLDADEPPRGIVDDNIASDIKSCNQ